MKNSSQRPLILQASSTHMTYDFYTSRIFVSATNIFMGQKNLSHQSWILPVLKNSFQWTLFLAPKIFILTTVLFISLENSSHRFWTTQLSDSNSYFTLPPKKLVLVTSMLRNEIENEKTKKKTINWIFKARASLKRTFVTQQYQKSLAKWALL